MHACLEVQTERVQTGTGAEVRAEKGSRRRRFYLTSPYQPTKNPRTSLFTTFYNGSHRIYRTPLPAPPAFPAPPPVNACLWSPVPRRSTSSLSGSAAPGRPSSASRPQLPMPPVRPQPVAPTSPSSLGTSRTSRLPSPSPSRSVAGASLARRDIVASCQSGFTCLLPACTGQWGRDCYAGSGNLDT